MNKPVEIIVGAAVVGEEGFVAEVERIDLDPTGSFAVRVAVRPRHEGGAARLLPAEELEPDADGGLRLRRTLAGFEELPLADGSGP